MGNKGAAGALANCRNGKHLSSAARDGAPFWLTLESSMRKGEQPDRVRGSYQSPLNSNHHISVGVLLCLVLMHVVQNVITG
jgi:hypothetical protein